MEHIAKTAVPCLCHHPWHTVDPAAFEGQREHVVRQQSREICLSQISLGITSAGADKVETGVAGQGGIVAHRSSHPRQGIAVTVGAGAKESIRPIGGAISRVGSGVSLCQHIYGGGGRFAELDIPQDHVAIPYHIQQEFP